MIRLMKELADLVGAMLLSAAFLFVVLFVISIAWHLGVLAWRLGATLVG